MENYKLKTQYMATRNGKSANPAFRRDKMLRGKTNQRKMLYPPNKNNGINIPSSDRTEENRPYPPRKKG